ncbi:hypothetical protein PVAND_002532 [Polypedilum vanderplanki]|uniref:Fe2OG dioxygenase domain-containing protein n=1 Tax=Polypedilum vanderplanki TaxID=319348 RepID=A0A9J6BRA5_POLVA|nr:hypothetical protein PVAND_002532 [Polypedilum vanderplanki]
MSKKILRKIKGKQAMLIADCNEIEFSSEPQYILGILNCGLKNGIKTEIIIERINLHARLEDIILPHNKSYCFLKFENAKDSEVIYNDFLGKTLWNECVPLLLSYVKHLPQINQNELQQCPDGLILIEDFITPEMENKLISLVKCDDNKMKNRNVQHFGYEFIYGSNSVDHNNPLEQKIPSECDDLWKLLDQKCEALVGFRPDQLTVNQYQSGQGIPSHCDTHSIFEDPIISLSLGSSIVMEFKEPISGQHYSKFLPTRSLLILSREIRYKWMHGIVPKKTDIIKTEKGYLTVQNRKLRYSFTFRKLKIPPCCDCDFKNLCDVKSNERKVEKEYSNQEVDENVAARLEKENVHKVYNEIGNHFSETRHTPWRKVENFINSLPEGSFLLDVGCGNGKYLGINEKITKFGCDRSDTLLNVCTHRNYNVFQCDCLQIPFIDESMDACISVAVIHHLSTKERRLQAISEMIRVLKTNGKALIYVWAKDQQKDNQKTLYLLQHQEKNSDVKDVPEIATLQIDENKIELPIHRNRTQFSHTNNGNVLVPWKLKQKEVAESEQKVFLRYYHVFDEGELETLCKMHERIKIVDSYYDQGNHCVILKKI